jgi:hypothetical protein
LSGADKAAYGCSALKRLVPSAAHFWSLMIRTAPASSARPAAARHEELGVFGKIDAHTSTLGKALGGSHGGFITGPKALVEYLRQKSPSILFSNTLPRAINAIVEVAQKFEVVA